MILEESGSSLLTNRVRQLLVGYYNTREAAWVSDGKPTFVDVFEYATV